MPGLKNIEPLINKKLSNLGLELFKLKQVKAGRRSILRVYIRKEGGVTITDCENASNEISILLDVENFSKDTYTLEVSSPGIDRTLTTEKDFKSVVGRTIKIRLREKVKDTAIIRGKLLSCSDGNLTVETQGGVELVPTDNINSGKIEINFK